MDAKRKDHRTDAVGFYWLAIVTVLVLGLARIFVTDGTIHARDIFVTGTYLVLLGVFFLLRDIADSLREALDASKETRDTIRRKG